MISLVPRRASKKPEASSSTEMIRLPLEVTNTLRRRARHEDITVAQAAREIVMGAAREKLTMLELVGLLRDRLTKRQEDLEEMFEEEDADADAIATAIDALSDLYDAWPEEEQDEESEEED